MRLLRDASFDGCLEGIFLSRSERVMKNINTTFDYDHHFGSQRLNMQFFIASFKTKCIS